MRSSRTTVVRFLSLLFLVIGVGCDDRLLPPDDVTTDPSAEERFTLRAADRQGPFGSDRGNYAQDVAGAVDGPVYVAGFASLPDSSTDAYLLKIDAAGRTLWERRYGGAGDQVAMTVAATPDGGALLGGFDRVAGHLYFHAIKVDTSGAVEWDSLYDARGSDFQPLDMAATPDGGFILVGSRHVTGYANGLVMRIDADGDILWEREIDGGGQETGYAVTVLDDGSSAVVVEGTMPLAPDFAIWNDILLLDPSGAIVDERREPADLPGERLVIATVGGALMISDLVKDSTGVTTSIRMRGFDRRGEEIWETLEPLTYSQPASAAPADGGALTLLTSGNYMFDISPAGAVKGRFYVAPWLVDPRGAVTARTADGDIVVVANTLSPHVGTESEIDLLRIEGR